MKVAVCYSGCVRDFLENYPSHKENLLDLYDCDVYYSFWDHWGHSLREISGVSEELMYAILNSPVPDFDLISESDKQIIVDTLNGVAGEFENFNSMLDRFIELGSFWQGMHKRTHYRYTAAMFYKIWKCNNILLNSGKTYDAVVRMRPDIMLTDKVIMVKPEPGSFYTDARVGTAGSDGKGGNDMFGYADMDTMTRYSKTYTNWKKLENIHQTDKELHYTLGGNPQPEGILRINCLLENVKMVNALPGIYRYSQHNRSTQLHDYISKFKACCFNQNAN